MIQHLNNITHWPNKQEPAANDSTTDYAVRRHTFTVETTSRLVAICREHGVTVTALLLAVQCVALLITFPPEDENKREASLNLVSNRLGKTTLSDVVVDETESESEKGAKKASIPGPVMATTFFVASCDVGDCIDAAKSHKGDEIWRESVWKVSSKIQIRLKEVEPQTITEKAYWTEGPTGFGLVSIAMGAMKSGNAPM